jgi:hypothetical protein
VLDHVQENMEKKLNLIADAAPRMIDIVEEDIAFANGTC